MSNKSSQDPRFLTNNQQNLLRAALQSNRPQQAATNPATVNMAALQNATFDDTFDADALGASFYEGDSGFDFDDVDASGVSLGDIEASDIHDKRKADDDSPDSDEGDAKRQEGDDKQAKKPGRKPLTTEPTTKRKAQNRAAQRAFRERKEKHLKDLETKVEELTKSSEEEKQQNGLLRAQVQRLQQELKEYRARMSSNSNRSNSTSAYKSTNKQSDFTFQFPAFGSLPTGSQYTASDSSATTKGALSNGQYASSNGQSPSTHRTSASASPGTSLLDGETKPVHRTSSTGSQAQQTAAAYGAAGLFNPGILYGANSAAAVAATGSPDFGGLRTSESPVHFSRFNSVGSGSDRISRINSEPLSNTQSPSQSSLSQFNPTSSCGTSPAVSQHPSPPKDAYPGQNLGTINEHGSANGIYTSPNTNSIDWLASQNGGQFDPVLFGDYREAQDAIVGDGDFNNGFFNDAFPFNFGSPLDLGDLNSPKPAQSTNAPAPVDTSASARLLAEVEATQAGVSDDYGLTAPQAPQQKIKNTLAECPDGVVKSGGPMLSANAIWHQLQSNKAFQDGEFDLDHLCDELKAKAKCSESGMAVPQTVVHDTFAKLSKQPYDPKVAVPVWDEASVNQAMGKLTGNDNWGGFGLTDEQLNGSW